MLLKHSQRDDLECPLMGRREHHVGGRAVVVGTQPVRRCHTPSISGHEAREVILGHRSHEIVADVTLVLQEFSGGHGAYRVAAQILGPRAAAPVSIEPGEGIDSAGLQLAAQHVAIAHLAIITQAGPFSAFSQTETWLLLSLVKGSRSQLLQRSRSLMPASRAIRSSSEGHT